ncbi:MAG: tRNA lysidine(34) synthetase TilS [Candidatus Accumulibacter sp.]|jgi:tRNA(Ile)-lysidine synthase|nr:tRNA lysidine(34) synthetase TilS [Accumulibacter sp.]
MVEPRKQPPRKPPEMEAVTRIDSALGDFFRPRLKPGDRVCAGLSGGMDSAALLHALWRLSRAGELPASVSAVHVHHGISPRADDWADFCRDFCLRLDVPLTIARVDVPRHSGEGLEGAARRRRHDVFAGLDADWLALAHHRDDQAETVLLKLLRGAGVSGAAGMPALRHQASGPVLARPLLGVARSVLLYYAQAHGLAWIEDESNDDRRFRRNFLRHDILPRLEREFPGVSVSLARCAGHFSEAAALLDDLAALDRDAVSAASGRIAVPAFNRLAPARARNLLRYAWARAGFRAPDAGWVGEALKQLATADASSEICLATADGTLRVYRGELYVVPPRETPPADPLPWPGQEVVPWAGGQVRFTESVGLGIRRSALEGKQALLKARRGGERLQTDARRPRRALRKLLQENAVPPWERERLPLLWIDGRLAWAAGIGCDAAFACPPGEAGILPSWESGHAESPVIVSS